MATPNPASLLPTPPSLSGSDVSKYSYGSSSSEELLWKWDNIKKALVPRTKSRVGKRKRNKDKRAKNKKSRIPRAVLDAYAHTRAPVKAYPHHMRGRDARGERSKEESKSTIRRKLGDLRSSWSFRGKKDTEVDGEGEGQGFLFDGNQKSPPGGNVKSDEIAWIRNRAHEPVVEVEEDKDMLREESVDNIGRPAAKNNLEGILESIGDLSMTMEGLLDDPADDNMTLYGLLDDPVDDDGQGERRTYTHSYRDISKTTYANGLPNRSEARDRTAAFANEQAALATVAAVQGSITLLEETSKPIFSVHRRYRLLTHTHTNTDFYNKGEMLCKSYGLFQSQTDAENQILLMWNHLHETPRQPWDDRSKVEFRRDENGMLAWIVDRPPIRKEPRLSVEVFVHKEIMKVESRAPPLRARWPTRGMYVDKDGDVDKFSELWTPRIAV